MIDKRVDGFAAALSGMKDGDTLLCGGFGSIGEAFALIEAVIALGRRELTVAWLGSRRCSKPGVRAS
jgi:3-oxoadipate CoA-transferase alpha subunit